MGIVAAFAKTAPKTPAFHASMLLLVLGSLHLIQLHVHVPEKGADDGFGA